MQLKVRQSRNYFFKPKFLPKNEQTNLTLLLWYLRSNCFRSFFGRNWRHQKDISKLTDLYKTHSRCMNYFNVSCTKPQTALIKLCSVYTLVVTILIHMYCTVHCLICNYHQLEMIINSLAMADGSSNDFKILMNYQSCMAKLID